MKRKYERPMAFEETFMTNEYEPLAGVLPAQ